MLEIVKTSLRITHNYLDDEVIGLIDSALLDLEISGVDVSGIESDALITRAVITYAKANFGYDNPEAERFDKSYKKLKQHLSLAGGYRATQ